ncbi:MAG: type II toxin-antitoxin system PemK/MazF family toxin [Acidobacteriota bacterium]
MNAPIRGEVWLAQLDPVRGHEQAGTRPVLVISDDLFNRGPAGLVIALPITSRLRPIPSHVRISPPQGGLAVESAALCEAVRSISKERLLKRFGLVRSETLEIIEDRLRILLRL